MIFTIIIIAQLIALALDNYSQLFLIDQAIFKKIKQWLTFEETRSV